MKKNLVIWWIAQVLWYLCHLALMVISAIPSIFVVGFSLTALFVLAVTASMVFFDRSFSRSSMCSAIRHYRSNWFVFLAWILLYALTFLSEMFFEVGGFLSGVFYFIAMRELFMVVSKLFFENLEDGNPQYKNK